MKAKGMAMARKTNLIGHRRSWWLSSRRVSGEIEIRAMWKMKMKMNEEVRDEGYVGTPLLGQRKKKVESDRLSCHEGKDGLVTC